MSWIYSLAARLGGKKEPIKQNKLHTGVIWSVVPSKHLWCAPVLFLLMANNNDMNSGEQQDLSNWWKKVISLLNFHQLWLMSQSVTVNNTCTLKSNHMLFILMLYPLMTKHTRCVLWANYSLVVVNLRSWVALFSYHAAGHVSYVSLQTVFPRYQMFCVGKRQTNKNTQ